MAGLWLGGVSVLANATCKCAFPDPCFSQAPWHELDAVVVVDDLVPLDYSAPGPQNMNQTDVLWLSDQPAAMQYSGGMGSRKESGWSVTNSTPAKVVRVHSAEDASAALQFASNNSIAVSVKATGHDFFARSTKPGSLLLWTHEMKNITWNDKDYTPDGCREAVQDTVTLGAGVQFWEVYSDATERQRLVMGGTCSTVGHVGWMLGGGYGDYSRMHGSGATNLVEAEVVLADGQIVKANACGQHKDLFRALRGGGGAFGLVTHATYRTHPYPEKQIGELEGRKVDLKTFLTWYANVTRMGNAKHFGGQAFVDPTSSVSLSMTYIGLDVEHCNEIVAPLNTTCVVSLKVWPTADAKNSSNGAEGWFPAWEHPLGYMVASNQRYFKLEDIEGERLQIFTDALVNMSSYDVAGTGLTIAFNYALGHAPPEVLAEVKQTSTHEDVGEAIAVLKVLKGHWNNQPGNALLPSDSTQINEKDAGNLEKLTEELENLLPDAGAYFNEGSYTEPRWQAKFWGTNYDGLLETKAVYDPENMFSCHKCVGSEYYEQCAALSPTLAPTSAPTSAPGDIGANISASNETGDFVLV